MSVAVQTYPTSAGVQRPKCRATTDREEADEASWQATRGYSTAGSGSRQAEGSLASATWLAWQPGKARRARPAGCGGNKQTSRPLAEKPEESKHRERALQPPRQYRLRRPEQSRDGCVARKGEARQRRLRGQ
eukprot:6747667-Alexandrium_andersonii.AAC.1